MIFVVSNCVPIINISAIIIILFFCNHCLFCLGGFQLILFIPDMVVVTVCMSMHNLLSLLLLATRLMLNPLLCTELPDLLLISKVS